MAEKKDRQFVPPEIPVSDEMFDAKDVGDIAQRNLAISKDVQPLEELGQLSNVTGSATQMNPQDVISGNLSPDELVSSKPTESMLTTIKNEISTFDKKLAQNLRDIDMAIGTGAAGVNNAMILLKEVLTKGTKASPKGKQLFEAKPFTQMIREDILKVLNPAALKNIEDSIPNWDWDADFEVAKFMWQNKDKEGMKKISEWMLNRPQTEENLMPSSDMHAVLLRMEEFANENLNEKKEAELTEEIERFMKREDQRNIQEGSAGSTAVEDIAEAVI